MTDETILKTLENCEGGWHRTSVFEAGYVTHWMPMPEADGE